MWIKINVLKKSLSKLVSVQLSDIKLNLSETFNWQHDEEVVSSHRIFLYFMYLVSPPSPPKILHLNAAFSHYNVQIPPNKVTEMLRGYFPLFKIDR